MKAKTIRRIYLREAIVMVLMARLAVRVVPSARLFAWANRPPRRIKRFAVDDVDWASWAVETAASNRRIQASSAVRALAVQIMLRRRGIASRLRLEGAAADGRLPVHAWIELGHEINVTRAEAARSA